MKENDVTKKLSMHIKEAINSDNDIKYTDIDLQKIIRWMKGHKTDLNHNGINSIRKSYKKINLPYIQKGLDFCCDAFAFKEISNTNVVVVGPVGENYHGVDEYVEIDSIFDLIKIMVLTAVDYCS